MNSLERIRENLADLVELGLARNIATSISLSVRSKELDILIHRGNACEKPTGNNTIYDLASLTKIIGTTIAVAFAIDRGKLSLDETPFPSWPNVSIANILAHKTGLPAHRKFYEELSLSNKDFHKNRDDIFAALFEAPILENHTERVYSDLGFMALGLLLEQRFLEPLFDIFHAAWRALLISNDFRWFPSLSPFPKDLLVAPTGFCKARNADVVAQVHDPNCYFLGGIAGHAGLFGTLSATAIMGDFFLRAAIHPKTNSEYLLRNFSRVGLGFDKPTRDGTTRYFSPRAFGHFGYTGVSLWMDPAWNNGYGIVVTLLTNRVNVSEKPEGIYWLRLAINRMLARERER